MKNVILLLWVVVLGSCQSAKDVDSSVKKVLLDINADQELRLSEIADTVEVIPLEQTYDSDIALVERIIPYKGHYYILNTLSFNNGQLLVFDKDGNFVRKIDKRGGGPGEYVDLQDIAIDEKNDELVFMAQPKGFYRYDLEGNFISKARGGYGMNIAVDGEGSYYKTNGIYEGQMDGLLMVNDEDSVSFSKVSPERRVMVHNYYFSNEFESHNGRVYHSYSCCDSIFDVTGGKRIPYLYIDYNGRNLPVDKIFAEDRSVEQSMRIEANYSGYFRMDRYRITDKFLFVGSFDGERHGIISLYSFQTGKVLSAHRLIDDVFFPDNTFTFRPFRMPMAVEDNCLLWLVNPSWLLQGYEYFKENMNAKEWESYCKRHPKIVEVCSKLDEESNPVLLKIRLKDF